MLQKTINFENSTIALQNNVCAAAVFSNRNPAYLLRKLVNDKCSDDPKYLPVIIGYAEGMPRLFVHYRRIVIKNSFENQMFVYLPTSHSKSAFNAIDFLFRSLIPRNDPWVKYRSNILFDRIFQSCIRDCCGESIKLLDLGCGSAQVSMNLCKMGYANERKTFHLHLLDVQYPRFSIANSFVRNSLPYWSVKYIRSDIFKWLTSHQPIHQYDIALLLRVLDARTETILAAIPKDELFSLSVRHQNSHDDIFEKTSKLLHSAPARVIHSLRKAQTGEGWFFVQIGLKDYFYALRLCLGNQSALMSREEFVVPIKKFNDSSLLLPDGSSAISVVMQRCRHLIIEDAELSQPRLSRHLEKHGLIHLIAKNASKGNRAGGAHLTLVSHQNETQ